MTNEQVPTTNRRRILAAAPLFLAGCISQRATSEPMDETNQSTADSEYDGVERPEQTGTNQSTDDVLDDDVYAVATADDPAEVAAEQGAPTVNGNLLAVAHLTVDEATEADAPDAFSRVVVTLGSRIEGEVPFGQLTELANAEQVERVATAEVTTKEASA